MIGVSTDYRQQLIAGNRNWVISVPVFLNGNNTNTPDFTLTNQHIWDNGIVLDEAISSDSSFDLGAAIVGSLKVVIDNINGDFSSYDFYGAKLTLWLGVEGDVDSGDNQRMYRIGFFVVDTPSYNGSLITLNCLDNMTWFDTPFDSVTGITYPANAGTVVQKICQKVGVTLGTPSFPNYSNTHTRILAKPEQELNCREMLQYIAQMCCCYCKINTAGQLELKWHDKTAISGLEDYDGGTFNTTTTPYSDGDAVDGRLFDPWETGNSYNGGTFDDLIDRAFISENFECEVSTDDVWITGVRVRNNTTKDATKAYDELWVDSTLEQTHERYVLIIDNNPLITKAEAGYIANIVGNTLAGLRARGFTATSLADFSYETGDMATVIDFRGNRYYTWITHFTFTTNNSERFLCGVESIKKRSEQRFSGTVKTLAEANANAEDILTAYDNAVKAMDALAQNAIGYREYVQTVSGAKIMYRYNGSTHTTSTPPKFQGSTVVFKISGDGVFVALAANGDIAADGTCTFSNGYDANSGTAILNLIYAQGLNANWINAGSIDASVITVTNLNASNITSGTMSADKIYGGTINGNNVAVTNLNASNITSGTMSANKISGGSIDANNVTITNLNASNITSGTMSASKISGGSIDATNVTITNLNADNISSGHLSCDYLSGGTINGQAISGCTITGGTITSNATNGSTTITGGRVEIIPGNDNYLSVIWDDSGDEKGVTFGRRISVIDQDDGVQGIFDYSTLFYSLDAHDSDRRVKKNIENISPEDSRNLILGIQPRYYEYNKDGKGYKGKRSGFIAQEVREVLDKIGNDSVIERENYRRDDGMRMIEYQDFIAHLVNTTQDLYKQVDELKKEIALLKEKVGEK